MIIRKYPWPFKAALSFSNDCDFLTLESMLSLHRYLAEKPERGGIGIECSDSFFFFQSRSAFPCYSYFKGTILEEEYHAGLLRELIRMGYLDTTHALGDFAGGNFNRGLAKAAFENIDKYGLNLGIWTNHGGYGNIQNIADKNCYYHQQGDDIKSPYYILDILCEYGIKYYAICTSYTGNMSLCPNGDIVPKRKYIPIKSVWSFPRINVDDNFSCKQINWNNALSIFHKIETRSGNILQGFYRYNSFFEGGEFPVQGTAELPDGRRPDPNLGRLSRQISSERLEQFIKKEGCSFLYQHFSTICHLPSRTHISPALEMYGETINSLNLLADYHREGKIWVASQKTLLDYLYMINTVSVENKQADDVEKIYVKVKAGYELRELGGLTVKLGMKPKKKVIFQNSSGKGIEAVICGPDENGEYYASIPFRRLPSVDWNALAKEFKITLPDKIHPSLIGSAKGITI